MTTTVYCGYGWRTRAALVVALAASTLLAACGGSEGTATQETANLQQERETAALMRAHALSADRMGKIKAERAGKEGKVAAHSAPAGN